MIHLFLAFLFSAALAHADETTEFALANGLRVRLVPNHAEKRVVVLLGVRAGVFDEPAGIPHLAHLVEHVTVFGAPPGSTEAKASQKWFASGKANAETLADFMYFDLHVAPEELPLALRLQAARLANPYFDSETLAREIPRALSEIDFLESPEGLGGPAKFAVCAFVQAAIHGRSTVPLKAATRAIKVDDVRAYHARAFRPDRAILSVIGDFDPTAGRKAIDEAFGSIPAPKSPPPARPAPKPGSVDATWDVATSHLLIGWPVPPASHADHAALTAASIVLTQRLYMDPEIAPIAKLPSASNEIDGLFFLNVQAKTGTALESLQAKILDRISRLSKPEGLGDPEVRMACLQLAPLAEPPNLDAMRLPANVTKTMALANMELQRMMKTLSWGDLGEYVRRLGSLEAAAVRAAAARYLDPAKATVVRVRPAT